MPDSPLPTSPPEQVVRFRMRTLLAITTIMAILAAIAGPYYPHAERVGAAITPCILGDGSAVLSYWTGVELAKAYGRQPANGRCAFRDDASLATMERSHRSRDHDCLRSGLVDVIESRRTVESSAKNVAVDMPSVFEIISVVGRGLWSGVVLSGMTMCILRVPVYLCENGCLHLRMSIAWRQFTEAEWAPGDRGVLQLCRREGDIYLYVPPDQRQEVFEFVQGKIRRSEEKPTFNDLVAR